MQGTLPPQDSSPTSTAWAAVLPCVRSRAVPPMQSWLAAPPGPQLIDRRLETAAAT